MSCSDTKGVVADINMRIELKRMIDRTLAMDNGPLAAILQVAVGTLDQRIAQPQSHIEEKEEPRSISAMICRNVRVDGRRTSVKLEGEYWQVLEAMAFETGGSLDRLCDAARRDYPYRSLASALRVYALAMLSQAAAPPSFFPAEGSDSGSKRSGRKRQTA
ncbi:Ribbon-helix-helix domain-containing protein [Magnetospirillum fulvum]|uniref:Ribbon-helix-helix domain-containing protein n=2 Tax=Magnetospirillum fulvum TaxID=1082 RepID=A0A1H6GTQ9_MAGFU|nr:Ribbon-helix-helix domain-containing protein [Magnetospirillum fulvum]